MDNIPALRALPEAERAPLVEQLVAHGREAFDEQTRLNRFLQPLRNAPSSKTPKSPT